MFRFTYTLLLISILSACGDNSPRTENTREATLLFKLLSPDSTQITFNNRIEENDIHNMVDFFYVYNGGGVAIGDINNDGLQDIYFTGNMVDDRLYLNRGALKFEDITEASGIKISGWSTGVTMVDINHDGLLDIYVSRSGNFTPEKRKNLLYINEGNLKFSERAAEFGLADTSYSTQAAFFDYDKDGDLDMYLLNHTNAIRDPNNLRPLIKDGSGPANDRLYRNEEMESSAITFTDVTQQAGILYDGLGLGVGTADINGDGWEDIFVTNDFIANDYLYINNKDGTFTEMAESYLDHVSHFSMGNDIADFNNDGLLDLITMDMRPKDNFHEKKMSGPLNFDLFERTLQMGYLPQYMRNTLQLNNGILDGDKLSFSEIGQLSQIDATDWSWAPLFADFNNDGLKDLFVTNGYLRDITDLDFINYTGSLIGSVSNDSLDAIIKNRAREMPSIELSNFLFQNKGTLEFEDVSEKWGLNTPSLSNGAAYADLDNDGDLDILTNNINKNAFVYENLSNVVLKNHFLSLALKGDSLNTSALGAKVTLYQNGEKQIRRQVATRGYQSSMAAMIHFGLGEESEVDSVLIQWPDGKISKVLNPPSDQALPITKNKTSQVFSNDREDKVTSSVFRNITASLDLTYAHGDKAYHDFNRQFLLPHKHSNQGPGLAVADINGDGKDDFFMGGGYNHSGTFFIANPSGKFKKTALISNEKEKYEEDTGALFFDYDADGDNDLYIVSGSNEFYEASEYYQDRLYTNDGRGNFTLNTAALPRIKASGSCVRASDFDQDGDLDLFVGGRLSPLKYPLPPNSYLLLNENGKFIDATNQLAPSLRKVGMVTDALWTDYDSDGDTDLITVGEFMAIQFFENQKGKLINSSDKTGLTYTSGWWNSINGGDFDNDGDMDYIVGNLGLNSKVKASPDEPVTVYASDFDKNGTIDPLITAYNKHIEYPIHSRDDLIKQIPVMKKKFPDYASYGKASLSDVLSMQDRSSSYIAKAFQFASIYLQNLGNGKFECSELPKVAQIAPIYGIVIDDFNSDGNLDVLLSGNDFGTEVGLGRYNASKGILLKGEGDGTFVSIPPIESGVNITGDSRSAVSIKSDGQLIHIFGRNSDFLLAYTRTVNKPEELISAPKHIAKAAITYLDGSERIHEFHYGASYLSQSTRALKLNGNEKQILLYDFQGRRTEVELDSLNP